VYGKEDTTKKALLPRVPHLSVTANSQRQEGMLTCSDRATMRRQEVLLDYTGNGEKEVPIPIVVKLPAMFYDAHSTVYETHIAELTAGEGNLRAEICFLEVFNPTQLETDTSIVLLHEEFPKSRVCVERMISSHHNFIGRSNHNLQGFRFKFKIFEPRSSLNFLT